MQDDEQGVNPSPSHAVTYSFNNHCSTHQRWPTFFPKGLCQPPLCLSLSSSHSCQRDSRDKRAPRPGQEDSSEVGHSSEMLVVAGEVRSDGHVNTSSPQPPPDTRSPAATPAGPTSADGTRGATFLALRGVPSASRSVPRGHPAPAPAAGAPAVLPEDR